MTTRGHAVKHSYDRPGVRLGFKVRMLKTEVIEALLHGCVRGVEPEQA